MAKERTSVRMQEQIKKMWDKKVSIRKIAKALGVSRKTVRKILGIKKEESEKTKETPEPVASPINWEDVRKEVGAGCTIKQIHKEVAPLM